VRRGISIALIAVLVVLLLLSVFTQMWVLPSEVERVAATFPAVEPLSAPSVIWGVVAIGCWQAIAVIGLRLVVLARDHRFDSSSYGLLRAIVGCLVAFVVLVTSAFIALSVMGYTTPVMLGLIACGVVALLIVVPLLVFLGANSVDRQGRA
jgi:Protein of unknown function (DUF2975)